MGKFADFVKKLYDVDEGYAEEEYNDYYAEEGYAEDQYDNSDFNQPVASYTEYEDVPYQEPQQTYYQPQAVATPVDRKSVV